MPVFFGIDEAYLVSAWVASFLWGISTMLVIYALANIITKEREQLFKFTTVSFVVLWILATSHACLSIARLITAFIHDGNGLGPVFYLADIGQSINRAKDLIYITTLWFGDSIIVWRCVMVWNKNWFVTALPMLLVLGTAISGYGAIGHYFAGISDIEEISKWGSAMFITSLVTNILATLLTASRIWYVARSTQDTTTSLSSKRRSVEYRTIILMIIDSGAVVTVVKILEYTLFELAPGDGLNGLNAMYIPYDCMPQIITIVPTLIIITVNRQRQQKLKGGSSGWSRTTPVHLQARQHTEVTTDNTTSIPLHSFDASNQVEKGKYLPGAA